MALVAAALSFQHPTEKTGRDWLILLGSVGGALAIIWAVFYLAFGRAPWSAPVQAATPTPCVAMPDGANHNRYDRSQWTCPVLGTTHYLEVRLVHYKGTVIGMRVLKLVP